MKRFDPITIAGLRAAYAAGELKPEDVVAECYRRIREREGDHVWITLRSEEEVMAEAAASHPDLPLYGIPFAVKDNLDVLGLPTTAACPAFSRYPEKTAFVVETLQAAGALLIGKTNMDQFATGLVGTRTPYGACSSVYHPEYVSGGSSSGSAVAVAAGEVAFSLGTDTAGSGRVPAAFNNLVGVKPTRGLLSTQGVLPACRSLDCVSIFAHSTEDAEAVLKIAASFDASDPWSRQSSSASCLRNERIGIPYASQLEFFGDAEAEMLFHEAARRLESQGFQLVPIDIAPFLEAARLLYSGAWVAERDHAVGDFLRAHPDDVDPTVKGIILGGAKLSAVDAFDGLYRLQEFRARSLATWQKVDAFLLPTTPTIYKIAEVQQAPVELNARLGLYTNFVNLLDLCALAIPAGFRSDGLPLGVTLLAPAFHDQALLEIARGVVHGDDSVSIAVVGAHLRGLPLNSQLVQRSAVFESEAKTTSSYRLFDLQTTPPKPGLVRVSEEGRSIDVEVWRMPLASFGSFVALIPPPLSIGSLELSDGRWVKGFLCEAVATVSAPDISSHGGWRNYLHAKAGA